MALSGDVLVAGDTVRNVERGSGGDHLRRGIERAPGSQRETLPRVCAPMTTELRRCSDAGFTDAAHQRRLRYETRGPSATASLRG